jgi:predicted ArsR family transcriptional regulator
MLALLAMAWDGQWFLKVYDEFGWEEAARLNARVRAAFGRIEMRRMLRALGKRSAADLEDAIQIILAYFRDVLAAGFDADLDIGRDRAEITVTHCAALSGSKRAGLERHDQACVACQGLWHTYFEVLLPDTPVEVEMKEQMGHGAPRCHIAIRAGRIQDDEG